MEVTGQLEPEAFWRTVDDAYHRVLLVSRRQVSYEILDAPGQVMIGSWQFDGGPRQLECFASGVEILVQTEDASEPGAEQSMLTFKRSFEDILDSTELDDVLASPDRVALVDVDGSPSPVKIWDFPNGWWGSAQLGATHVAIRAVGYDLAKLRLQRTKDITPFVQARLRWLREQRGE
ncbi:MAG: hypothetical protein KIT89_13370 [Microcella sp.]|uniref:hypothetical protein n=1 Tax=Microcella sp. TaxID=1913979 RepID=UPI0024C6DB8C|nr:hypothetical protein [Microcella sp.]UYN83640.1 MAG: hypothetical protein KIT89_13370 [Microcella sp.]